MGSLLSSPKTSPYEEDSNPKFTPLHGDPEDVQVELECWIERLYTEQEQYIAHSGKMKLMYFWGSFLPVSIISAGTSLLSQTDFQAKNTAILVLSCASALCAGIAAYWNWGELAERHLNTSKLLEDMVSDASSLKYQLCDAKPRDTPCSHFWREFQKLQKAYSKLKGDAPALPAKRIRAIDTRVRDLKKQLNDSRHNGLADAVRN